MSVVNDRGRKAENRSFIEVMQKADLRDRTGSKRLRREE